MAFFTQNRAALTFAGGTLSLLLVASWFALPFRLYFFHGRISPVVAWGRTWTLEPAGRCRGWGSGTDYLHEVECDRDGDGEFDCRVTDCHGGGARRDCAVIRDARGDWHRAPPELADCATPTAAGSAPAPTSR